MINLLLFVRRRIRTFLFIIMLVQTCYHNSLYLLCLPFVCWPTRVS